MTASRSAERGIVLGKSALILGFAFCVWFFVADALWDPNEPLFAQVLFALLLISALISALAAIGLGVASRLMGRDDHEVRSKARLAIFLGLLVFFGLPLVTWFFIVPSA